MIAAVISSPFIFCCGLLVKLKRQQKFEFLVLSIGRISFVAVVQTFKLLSHWKNRSFNAYFMFSAFYDELRY